MNKNTLKCSHVSSIFFADLKTEPDNNRAASIYTKELLCQHETRKPLFMTMDLRMDREDQDRDLIAFYKQTGIEWASPVKCRLEGAIKSITALTVTASYPTAQFINNS